jgi:hypothetical protein
MTGIALIGVALFVQLSTSPIEGHWVANLAKSKLSPAFPFHSATLDVVVKGDAVSFTDKVVTAPGKEEGHSNLTFISDGKEHAFEGTATRRRRCLSSDMAESANAATHHPEGRERDHHSDVGGVVGWKDADLRPHRHARTGRRL